MEYIIFSVAVTYLSWIVGILGHALIKHRSVYRKLSNLNFMSSKRANALLGIKPFAWLIKNTFLRFFNPGLKVNNPQTADELKTLRNEMTKAEVGHLIGFAATTLFALIIIVTKGPALALSIMAANVLMNLYPVLLQQENKRRLDRLIRRWERKQHSAQD